MSDLPPDWETQDALGSWELAIGEMRRQTNYDAFLRDKTRADMPNGFINVPDLSPHLKPFQRALTTWALRRGRAALFEGTGLGKSLQALSWARAVADLEQGPVLIETPLAVAEQFVAEASKFEIPGVSYAADQNAARSDIVISNYERFEKFDISQFAGIVCDESGILKSVDGRTRAILTDACKDMRWRLCCTATPAPNDYSELGQHAEFLGVMTAKEMLSMYFVHDGSIRANAETGSSDGWRLKRHAESDFWRWLASWAAVIRSPSDLGFDGAEYELPELRYHQIAVPAPYAPVADMLFPIEASTLGERLAVRRETIDVRVAAAINVVNREPGEAWLIWCHLNREADLIEAALPHARQVAGAHSIETKVGRLLGFTKADPLHLVSKPSIAGHGMNWQHCSRMVFVGLNDSFEQLFQAIRRCWRFGQTRPVDVYMIASELEGAVVTNLRRKEADFEAMLDAMSEHMRDLVAEQVLGHPAATKYDPITPMEIPPWLT